MGGTLHGEIFTGTGAVANPDRLAVAARASLGEISSPAGDATAGAEDRNARRGQIIVLLVDRPDATSTGRSIDTPGRPPDIIVIGRSYSRNGAIGKDLARRRHRRQGTTRLPSPPEPCRDTAAITAPRERHDITEATQTADSKETTERKQPTDSSEPHDPTEPIERTDPTLPMERTEPFEAMERTESREAMDQREPGFVRTSPS